MVCPIALQSVEFQLLQQDIDILQQFVDSDSVTVGGQTYHATCAPTPAAGDLLISAALRLTLLLACL